MRPVTHVAEVAVNTASGRLAPLPSAVANGSIRRKLPSNMAPRKPKIMICEGVSLLFERSIRSSAEIFFLIIHFFTENA